MTGPGSGAGAGVPSVNWPNTTIARVPSCPDTVLILEAEPDQAAVADGVAAAVPEDPPALGRYRTPIAIGLVIMLLPLVWLSWQAWCRQVGNARALKAVLRVGKAVAVLPGADAFALSVAGPFSVPRLESAEVPEGTTLFVRRWSNADRYVRGADQRGSVTYHLWNGILYVEGTPGTP